MKRILAFDVYGTLIDTSGILSLLKEINVQKADSVVKMWRTKQLEYSFRQTAMGIYKGFSFCTETALEFTCKYHDMVLTKEQKNTLLGSYNKLPVFDKTRECLNQLKNHFQLYAFSNGELQVLKELLSYNNIDDCFSDIISVEDTEHFKPSPEVYEHFNRKTNTKKDSTFLVSSNPFDIIGASHYGLGTIWLKNDPKAIFDDWGIKPDYTIGSLEEILTLEF